jgi:Icc protein
MLVAQITDTHITPPGTLLYGAVDTAAALEKAVASLARLRPTPDVVLITGDLVDLGEPEEYTHLRALLAPLGMPVLAIPGNHDSREPLRRAFEAEGYFPRDGFLHYAVEHYPLRIVALDTLVPGEPGGALCKDRLRWIDETLAAAPDRPTLVAMHHPPFPTGILPMDRMGLAGSAGFAEIIRRHPQVERICCGHLHRAIDRRFAGTVAGTAPSTAHQTRLDLRPEEPLSFVFEPPGYQLHFWDENTGLVTHTAMIGEWPQVYRAGIGGAGA